MKITKDVKFSNALDTILDYISKDGVTNAVRFNRKLQKSINSIPNFPYKSRKSFYYEDDNIRDYIFKGYTLPYLIDTNKNQIVILDIFKWIDR